MRFFFRVDASELIGVGHVMRCLTLAKQLTKTHHEVVFLYSCMPSYYIELIDGNGCHTVSIENENIIGSVDDATYVVNLLKSMFVLSAKDWMIIDHYSISEEWELIVGQLISNILIIDDLANRKHHCSVLIDTNPVENYEHRYDHLVPPITKKLLGPQYALLREEFIEVRERFFIKHNNEIQNILVSFGGSDPTNETLKVIKALDTTLRGNDTYEVTVILGRANPYISQIKAHRTDIKVKILIQPPLMAKEMANADLAICGGGTMTWERYSLGLPAMVIAVADNQIEIAKQGECRGIDIFLGESRLVSAEMISSTFLKLIRNKAYICQARSKAWRVVDGKGANRVVDFLLSL